MTEGFYVLRKTKSPFPLVLTRITLVGLFQPLGFLQLKKRLCSGGTSPAKFSTRAMPLSLYSL